jgi:hypothetical protein
VELLGGAGSVAEMKGRKVRCVLAWLHDGVQLGSVA